MSQSQHDLIAMMITELSAVFAGNISRLLAEHGLNAESGEVSTSLLAAIGKEAFLQNCEVARNEQLRMMIDLDIDAVADAHPVGTKFEWDVAADLVPGQFGRIELARKKTLRPLVESKPASKTQVG